MMARSGNPLGSKVTGMGSDTQSLPSSFPCLQLIFTELQRAKYINPGSWRIGDVVKKPYSSCYRPDYPHAPLEAHGRLRWHIF